MKMRVWGALFALFVLTGAALPATGQTAAGVVQGTVNHTPLGMPGLTTTSAGTWQFIGTATGLVNGSMDLAADMIATPLGTPPSCAGYSVRNGSGIVAGHMVSFEGEYANGTLVVDGAIAGGGSFSMVLSIQYSQKSCIESSAKPGVAHGPFTMT